MTVFILPTTGATKYRGKYPNRARSISGTTGRATGRHIELNNGLRLWSCDDRSIAAGRLADDYSEVVAKAVPMTDAQYGELKRAAEMLRGLIDIAGHGRRARLEEAARAVCLAIKPDSNNYAKRNAEHERRDATARGSFKAGLPFRVYNRTPQFSGCFDFATLAEARDYLAGQIARRDSVVSGAAPVGPDSNSQCPLQSFIIWAEGTETLGDMGWTPPADGTGPRWGWNPPASETPATGETARRDNAEYHKGQAAYAEGLPIARNPYSDDGRPDNRFARWNLGWNEAQTADFTGETSAADAAKPESTVRINLRRQADEMGEIATAERRAAIAPIRETIDMTPSWAGILPALRALIENSNAEGRRTAWEEIAKMAGLADERNALASELAPYGPTPSEAIERLGAIAVCANESWQALPAGMARDEMSANLAAAGFAV